MAKFYTVAFRQQAEAQFGARQATEVATRAAASARRQLMRSPIQTQHAFEHLSDHFRLNPSKPAHGVFLATYQQPAELTKLLLKAIDRPGTEPMLSKSDDNDWAVVIQSWFGAGNPIGFSGTGPARRDLTYLMILVDLNGDLITAYPTAGYQRPGNRV
ncbi:MAG: hypothetical protein ABI353_06505 [Isosphaeraceae bacterium]